MIYIHNFLPSFDHSYIVKFKAILDYNKISYVTVDSHEPDFWDIVVKDSLFLMYLGQTPMHLQRQLTIISTLDKVTGVRCFPNWDTAWHFDDKVAQYLLLKSYNLPGVGSNIFWDKRLALDWAEHASFPQVFKLKGGAGSLNVVKIHNVSQARNVINQMFGKGIINGNVPGVELFKVFRKSPIVLAKSYMKQILYTTGLRFAESENWSRHQGYALFQDFLPNNNFDTRVTVIGNKAFAFRRLNRPGDFRSSGSGLLDHDISQIDIRCVQVAHEVSQRLGFQTMAYDFLYDTSGLPVIVEMCCQFADWAVYDCPGYWDDKLNWHDGHYWPQLAQLQMLLGDDSLKQPEFQPSMRKTGVIPI